MKKLLLILITLTTFINVSYASFPVTDIVQTEVVESAAIICVSESPSYMILGFFIGFFSWVLLFLPLLLLFVPNKSLKKGIIAGFLSVLVLIGLLFSGEIFGYAKHEN